MRMWSGEREHSWGLPLFQRPGDLPSDPEARTPWGGEREALLGGSRASSHNMSLQAERKPVNKSVGSTRPLQRKWKAWVCGKEEMWFWAPKRGGSWKLRLRSWGQSWARVLADYERNGLWILRKGRGHQEGLTVTSASGQLKASVYEYVCTCTLSRVWLYLIQRTVACQAPLSWNVSGKNIGVGCHFPIKNRSIEK